MRQLGIITLLLVTCSLWAGIQVKGIVIDEQSEPMIGVNVIVKGTQNGTITDYDGFFSIEVNNASDILQISYIGYKSKELVAGNGKKTHNIQLLEDRQAIDEVVVVGYQDMRKRDLTGSVAKADINEMLKAQVPSFDQALAGRIAGVQVSSSEGMPGGTMNIVIRGNNSVTQDNSPLYIIDGFPIEDPSVASTINPNDIESLDVLKDASATAIYGSRGANGVVIITTKKGAVGKMQINYDGSVGFQQVTRTIPMMDSYEFVRLQTETYYSTTIMQPYSYFPVKGEITGDYSINNTYFKDLLADKTDDYRVNLEDYRNAPFYDWQSAIFRTALVHSHNLSVTGGTQEVRYNAGLSYYDQDGVVICSNYKRVQGRVGLDIKRNRLSVNLKANFSHSENLGNSPSERKSSGMSNLFYSVWSYRPTTQPSRSMESLMNNALDDDVSVNNDTRYNPIKSLNNEYSKNIYNTIQFNGFVEYEFIKGLKLRVTGGYTYKGQDVEKFYNSSTRYGMATATNKVNATYNRYATSNWINEDYLTYQTTVKGAHHINAMVGFSYQGQRYKLYGFKTGYIPYESLGMAGMSLGTPISTSSSLTEWTMLSGYARFNYNYKSRYYLTATFRADGSSKMAKGNKFGYFPSVSAGWTITEENWAESAKPWLSNLKIRASWGQTGNNRVDSYAAYAQLSQLKAASGNVSSAVYGYNNNTSNVGVVPISLANENLKWETTTQTDIGLDLGLFSDRLTIVLDWYNKVTHDLLIAAELKPSSGYPSATKNIGSVQNTGWEFSFNTVNIKRKHFEWTTAFNIAFNKNKVLGLAENQAAMLTNAYFDDGYTAPNYIAKVGYPIGMMYGYVYEGTYKLDEFTGTAGSYMLKEGIPYFSSEANTQPGMPKYADLDGNGVIDSNDQTFIGRGDPIHTGGFNNTWTFYGVDLSVFLQWSYGNDILNANRLFFENGMMSKDRNMYATYADRWTLNNPTSDIPAVHSTPSNSVFSSRIIEDGSYLRLKTISLGYTLPQSLTRKAKIEKVHFAVSFNNVFTWTNYSGYDPEVSVRNSALTPGMDYSAYPRARTCMFNFNIVF